MLIPLQAVTALQALHRRELADMEARLLRYRAILAEHGLEVDEREDPAVRWAGDEHFAGCMDIVRLAHDLMEAVDGFRDRLGTAQELLEERWRE
jgi:hypothetical protein